MIPTVEEVQQVLRGSGPDPGPGPSIPLPASIARVPYEPPLMEQMQRWPQPAADRRIIPDPRIHPYQIIDATNPTDGVQIRVCLGMLNGIKPDGMSDGDDPQYILPISGSGVKIIQLGATVDAGNGYGSSTLDGDPWIEAVSSITADDKEAGEYYMTLGGILVSGGAVTAISQNVRANLTLFAAREWFSFDPVTYVPLWGTLS
jgi:hypothetical protein